MRKRIPAAKANAGFSLVEVGIAAVIAGMAATAGLYYQAQEMRYQLARAQVDQLKVLNNAVGKYQAANAAAILNGTSVTGVATPAAPTVAELKALKFLDANFSGTNLYSQSGNYRTLIRPSPAGCTGAGCSLFSLVYLDTPVVDAQGRPDSAAVGEALSYGGGNVGVSTAVDRATIRGTGNLWNEPSPLPTTAGILAMRTNGDGPGAYVALDGSSTMVGGLKMGANDITGVRNVTTSGTVSAASVTASSTVSAPTVSATNVSASGNVSGNGVYGNYVQANGDMYATRNVTGGQDVWAARNIGANNMMYSNGAQVWGNSAVNGQAYSGSVYTGTATVTENLNMNSDRTISNWGRQHINAGENLYLQPWSGGTTNVGGGGGSGQLNVYGNIAGHNNWWSMITRDGWGGDNVSPQSAAGSLYVNDIYVRSAGRWASQIANNGALKFGGMYESQWYNPGGGWRQGPGCWGANPVTGGCSCPGGYSAHLIGMTFHYSEWDGAGFVCWAWN